MKIESIKKKKNSKELLPQIIERIFAICRTDSNFELKDNLEEIEDKITTINKKNNKQDQLIEQSTILKNDLMMRLKIITEENEKKQMTLLESIGDI